ncbi:MAG TPA: neutral/alkaline non-lysosomal ceramidase N-terminal domain-containing protein, partial [Thermomicrobiales bacterium]|nr:neutral/alkaline non-lysosomal ceramidase N-terminal domain-containing protein [Thermomicrobiales bacterium]
MTTSWTAGAARVPFPVPVGTPMAGYAARTGPSTGTLDGLTIGALALENGGDRLLLVAADLAAVDRSLVDEIAVAARLNRSELVVCASHTHSGPAGVITRMHPGDVDRLNPILRAGFIQRCVQAIELARERANPVELVFGQVETRGLAANRNGLDGPFDPRVSVLAARDVSGQIGALLVQFACHPTILSAANRLISAEFPGAMRAAAEAALSQHGEPPVVLFANGAAGDVSTRYTRASQDQAEVERVGHGLATAALEALAVAEPVGPGIGFAAETVTLAPRSLDELPRSNASQRNPGGDSVAERRKAETRAQGAMLLDRLAKSGPDAIQRTFEIPAWRLGNLGLVAVPGELFASLGKLIVRSVPGPVLVLGYANGYVGYLVDDAAHAAGTYEALASPFASGAGDVVANA